MRQVAYLLAVEDALASRQPPSDLALAERLGIHRRTFIRWRQDPAFLAWYRARMDRTSDAHWPMILRRHELSAMAGSVQSAEFIARVRREGAYAPRQFDPGGMGDGSMALIDASKHYTVQLLVQRPDDVASSKVLPLDHPALVAAAEALQR